MMKEHGLSEALTSNHHFEQKPDSERLFVEACAQ
jgi:hypothetical protein